MLVIAGVIIGLSFGQTAKLAGMVGATEWYKQMGFAVLVEILFAVSLLIRANQRASGKHVPWFLHIGYFGLLGVVTIINMAVLYQMHPYAGPFVGALISAAMLYTESIFVWINTDADRPHKKSVRELKREAKREVKEAQIIQEIEYMKYEAKKPNLKLIKKARKAEEKRKKIEADGLPEFFTQKPEPVPEVVPEPVTIVQEPEEVAEVVPIRRPIGFHTEKPQPKVKAPAPHFQPNKQARAEALQKAKELFNELGRIPEPRELMQAGLSKHYAGWAREQLKNVGDGIE